MPLFLYLISKTAFIDLRITPVSQTDKWRFRKVNNNNKDLSQTIKYKAKVLGTNVGPGRYRSLFPFHSCDYLASYLAGLNESFLHNFLSGLRPMPLRERSSFLPTPDLHLADEDRPPKGEFRKNRRN